MTVKRAMAAVVLAVASPGFATATATATASADNVLAPVKLRMERNEVVRDRGQWTLRIPSIIVVGVSASREVRVSASCRGPCRRHGKPSVRRSSGPGSAGSEVTRIVGLDWRARNGSVITVKVFRKTYVGRYIRMRVRRKAGAILLDDRSEGCLNGRGRRIRCGSGIVQRVDPNLVVAPPKPIPTPVPATQRATIQAPPNNEVPKCWVFQGTAEVFSGNTVVLAVKNLSNDDPNTYFRVVTNWPSGSTGIGPWSEVQFFGSDDSSVGQSYKLTLYIMSKQAVLIELTRHGDGPTQPAWAHPAPPAGSEVAAVLGLSRIPGDGSCPP